MESTSALSVRSIWHHFQGASHWGRFPGLKPRAEAFSPFRARQARIAWEFLTLVSSNRNRTSPRVYSGFAPLGPVAGHAKLLSVLDRLNS
jgi:hypothetical protein